MISNVIVHQNTIQLYPKDWILNIEEFFDPSKIKNPQNDQTNNPQYLQQRDKINQIKNKKFQLGM